MMLFAPELGPTKKAKYTELVDGNRCRLVVVALGRWSEEAVTFITDLAAARAREAPPVLRRSVFLAWRIRLSLMISTSCGRAFACSLVPKEGNFFGADGAIPELADLSFET